MCARYSSSFHELYDMYLVSTGVVLVRYTGQGIDAGSYRPPINGHPSVHILLSMWFIGTKDSGAAYGTTCTSSIFGYNEKPLEGEDAAPCYSGHV